MLCLSSEASVPARTPDCLIAGPPGPGAPSPPRPPPLPGPLRPLPEMQMGPQSPQHLPTICARLRMERSPPGDTVRTWVRKAPG